MSEFPPDWQVLPLSEVAERVRRTSDDQNLDVLTISSTEGWVDQKKKWARDMAGKSIEKYTLLQQGEFSYNKGNSKTYPQGCIFRLENWNRALVPNVYHSFSVINPEADGKFLQHLFAFGGLNDQLRSVITSSVRDNGLLNITADTFFSCEVPVPPLPEQKKIAEILSGIDHVIASNQNRIRSSQLLKKALISRHIESIEHEVDEAKLGDLVNSVDSGWSPDCLKRPPLSDSEWSVLKTTSVTWKGFDHQERKALPINLSPKEELVVEAGDILITRAGPADRTGVVAYADKKAVNTMISDKIIRLRCDTSTIEPRFLSIFLGTDYAQRQMLKGKVGMASSQTNISQQLLRDMEIRFPPLPEQRRISEIIAELQKTINQFQKYIDHTEKLKVSLSSDLLSGRKRVSI